MSRHRDAVDVAVRESTRLVMRFRDSVVRHRLNEHTKKLDYYTGNYDSYVRERSIRDDEQQRKYDAEQRDIAEIKDFIARCVPGVPRCLHAIDAIRRAGRRQTAPRRWRAVHPHAIAATPPRRHQDHQRGFTREPRGPNGLKIETETTHAIVRWPRRASTPYTHRFGHGTVKMVRQAQSREKLLQKKLEEGLTEKPQRDAEWDFSFPDPGELPTPVLMIQDVSFAYPNSEPLYHNLDLGIDLQSRIALVGPNGAGKTTFVKLMTGELQPTSGAVRPHSHLRMAKFTQHFEDVLDLEQNALEWIHALYPKVFTKLEMARTWLGRYGCTAKQQEMPMKQLSDGQKARIVFAKLAMDKPHLLMLDEPTNHLQRPVSCISPFHGAAAPSLHSNASSPGEEAVGGLLSDSEPILMVLSAQGHGVD